MCFICSSVGSEKAGGKGEREKGTGSAEILKPKTEDVCCLPSKYIKVSTCWPVANIGTCVTCLIVFCCCCGKAVEHQLKYFGKGAAKLLGGSRFMQTACFVPWELINAIHFLSHSYGFENRTMRLRQRSNHTDH